MADIKHLVVTTRSDTRTVTLAGRPEQVFAFVANPENLPRWAVGFCRAIRRDVNDPDRWIVTTAQGEAQIRYVTDPALGVIDFHLSPGPGIEAAAFSRIVPNGDGAEYVFTQLQPLDMPDEAFRAQVDALIEELQVLRSLIRAQTLCPA